MPKQGLLDRLVNHVALPPKLPGSQDDLEQVDNALRCRLEHASIALRDALNGEFYDQGDNVRYIIHVSQSLNAGGKLNRWSLTSEFRALTRRGLLILYISEQNAGLLIRREQSENEEVVVFEAFEASPLSANVLAAENALQWDFPGECVAVPYSTFSDVSFQDCLATFLEQSSTECIKRFGVKVEKSGCSTFETRDTADPSMITGMLMTLLEANGHRCLPKLLRKRVHDDVCWSEGGEKPWRRSPFWLVLRVGVERYLCETYGAESGKVYYKFLLCLMISQLLRDALNTVEPELLMYLKTKLCHRIAKLQVDRDRSSRDVRPLYEILFSAFEQTFRTTISDVNYHVDGLWSEFKRRTQRQIGQLPRRANRRDLTLSLPSSERYITEVLQYYQLWDSRVTKVRQTQNSTQNSVPRSNQFTLFADLYYRLSDMEIGVETTTLTSVAPSVEPESTCLNFASRLEAYLEAVGDAYDSNPEQRSAQILCAMKLWVLMDRCATQAFGLLKDYNPGIPPDSLDVLHLSYLSDLARLQEIQNYLEERWERCGRTRRTIFDDPESGCFAERYFDNSKGSAQLQELQRKINRTAESKRQAKVKEWEEASARFEKLEREISQETCLLTTDLYGSVIHNDKDCRKCYLQRCARRMQIHVHEDPLPSKPVEAKAMIFELGCPKAFKTYRNATWKLIGTLGRSASTAVTEPRLLLQDYSETKQFVKKQNEGITLASVTKSFLKTHYRGIRFPVDLESVCYSNGLRLKYFDTLTQLWPGRQWLKPDFAHHCRLNVTGNSSLFSLLGKGLNGRSSYEIVACQTNCPPGLNIHEFMAYQTVASGQSRRWISILVELGSANLNFSVETTAKLISHLASQVGPADPNGDPLRVVHKVFRDKSFCDRLMEQIRRRLDGITPNWRETTCMEMLLTLILKLCFIGARPVKGHAMVLLEKARGITLGWINQLRAELHTTTNATTAERCSKYGLQAALLCRRTFSVYDEKLGTEELHILGPAALRTFIESSITMQDNMVSDPAVLDDTSRMWLIRDLKMAHRMRSVLQKSLDSYPMSLEAALNTIWPQPGENFQRSYSDPQPTSGPRPFWFRLSIHATEHTKEQAVLYHLLEGHLLVDGEPLGKLPEDHRKALVLKRLFGNQTLLTYPSYLPGMTYTLAFAMQGHQVHFGFRNGTLIVQACHQGTILELVPQEIFGNPTNFDLPAALIDNCAHWLDLKSGIVDIRPESSHWKSKSSDWRIDFKARTAYRRLSILVDPNSQLFHRVARMFERFEHPSRLTVFQPNKINLSVELRRLELSFFVNQNALLECRELKSEVDPDQDAGTWYGLDSKIVVRDTANYAKRSILVPMGELTCSKNKFHVALSIGYSGNYGSFAINHILGRLDCAAEPWLLFMKAQLHAYTSFVLPDPLTGRTGTEEAIHCLKSGYCQPWAPLNIGPLQSLISIAKLSPRRTYYPSGSKNMQHVFWNPQLTMTIHHDAFRPIVDRILKKSADLSLFTHKAIEAPEFEQPSEPVLHRRAYWKRLKSQRRNAGFDVIEEPEDLLYASRDHFKATLSRQNVYEAATIIRTWPSRLYTASDLAGVLQGWPNIKGYDDQFNKVILSDILDIDFAAEWGSLANLCLQSGRDDMYKLMMMFALMSYSGNVDMLVIRTLISFAILEDIKSISPPKWTVYANFRLNQIPSQSYLKDLISPCFLALTEYEDSGLLLSYKSRRQREKKEKAQAQEAENECTLLADFLLKQWPCQEPTLEGCPPTPHIDVGKASSVLFPEWLRLFQNIELSDYIEKVQLVLHRHLTRVEIKPPHSAHPEQEILPTRCRGGENFDLSQDLLRKPGPNVSFAPSNVATDGYKESGSMDSISELTNQLGNMKISKKQVVSSPEERELAAILEDIASSESTIQQQYAWEMVQSLHALKKLDQPSGQVQVAFSIGDVSQKILQAREEVHERFERLNSALEHSIPLVEWLQAGGLWPCVTPVTLLEQLRSTSTTVFGSRMKESLLAYAVAITALQRLERLQDACLKGNRSAFQEELRNAGHTNWKPDDHGDWLLLEIDSNMLIRPVQVDVALATISPSSGSNSVLQMNMGQGKTSCIMPMAAAELSDAASLLRLIVPKALLVQTAQLLQSRLGGLIGREISHVPFSRKTPTDSDTIKSYFRLHDDIKGSRGVILALPEHIMSFKLSGLQRLSDSRVQEAKPMIKIQNWIQKISRDILDECDFTLAARTQLIYPSGSQTTIDGHPQRWETAEELLHLVENHLWNLHRDFPESIEVVQRSGGRFPTVFFLRKDVEDALQVRLVKDIIHGQTSILSMKECAPFDRFAIKSFISNPEVQPSITQRVSQLFPKDVSARQNIYLLRGLLVHRILLLALKKRWNVQYGLHPARDPIAVPFHAKGVPSDQAEWGHPDVAILFTCLSFYFGGLELLQLRQSLQHLVKSDDPSSEYDRWTQSCSELPGTLRDWSVINVDDEAQLTDLWQYMRYQVVAIDYFMNHFVFPRHAKQFQVKLQTSGWDIPLFSPVAKSTAMTTGFSGTNDNRSMLPLTIKQQDLPALLHTNAEVLTYLLQQRSRGYIHVADMNGKHLSEIGFLKILCDMKIRVLIDAGAMILEMDNLRLAEAWLKVDYEAPAVVYFDSDNKPFVLYRGGKKVPLLASPFAENLGDCLVYLDEAHTRGTDLKMRSDAVGALTLGLGQTKDNTVQAAMRLRQLATSQSVVFFAPPEVHQSIIDLREPKRKGHQIDSSDVISWLLKQTCNGIEQIQPLYYAQGIDFCRRTQAALNNPSFMNDTDQRDAYCEVLRQAEKQTLAQLYKPASKSRSGVTSRSFHASIAPFVKELNQRRKHFQDFGHAVHGSALQEVEQEREVAYEVESVREVEKPVHYSALSFPGLHPDIKSFALTGRISAGYRGFEPAFTFLKRTGLGLKHGIVEEATSGKLFVSREFSRTVNLPSGRRNDNLIRQVNWILWGIIAGTALIIIPEEAEILIPLLRDLTVPATHLLTYSAPVTRNMLHFNHLTYYAIPDLPGYWKPPTWLSIELGILAGRAYFDYGEYEDLCQYLDIKEGQDNVPKMDVDTPTSPTFQDADGPVLHSETAEGDDEATPKVSTFTAKPLVFLQEWLALRRRGQDFTHTPMGYVCQNKALGPDHPFFAKAEGTEVETKPNTVQATNGTRVTGQLDGRGGESDSESDAEFDEDDIYLNGGHEVGVEDEDDESANDSDDPTGDGQPSEDESSNDSSDESPDDESSEESSDDESSEESSDDEPSGESSSAESSDDSSEGSSD